MARKAAWRCSGDVKELGRAGEGPLGIAGIEGIEGSLRVVLRFLDGADGPASEAEGRGGALWVEAAGGLGWEVEGRRSLVVSFFMSPPPPLDLCGSGAGGAAGSD